MLFVAYSDELQKLETELQKVKEKLQQTSNLAESSQRDATTAFNEALFLSSEIRTLTLPSIDSDKIKAAATETAHNVCILN